METIALAGLGIAALAFAAPASADLPGLAPFVGSWHAHEEGPDIQPNGHGRETYSDRTRQGSFKSPAVHYALSATTTDPRSMMEHIREEGLINGAF